MAIRIQSSLAANGMTPIVEIACAILEPSYRPMFPSESRLDLTKYCEATEQHCAVDV
ncbi:MAG: hypothetical protein AAGH89_00670 [Verrucomicrobiota bacterium]